MANKPKPAPKGVLPPKGPNPPKGAIRAPDAARAAPLLGASEWLSEPHQAVARYFSDEGPFASSMGGNYAQSFVQVDFAQAVTDSVIRGIDDPGRVKFLEADTGVGKTHGYLGPCLLHCVLTNQRMVVSTYTNELKAQVGWKDGPMACDAVERMTGVRPTVALYLPYAEFASPERCRNAVARLLDEGRDDPVKRNAAAALTSLADWTDGEVAFAMASTDPQVEVVSALRGIVSTWQQDNPDLSDALPKEMTDLWCVDATCCARDLILRGHYANAVDTATCVVCTHALLLIDLKVGGNILGGRVTPFAVTVVDEAHRMDDAARSVLGIRVALSSLERSLNVASDAMRVDGEAVPDVPRVKLGHDMLEYASLFEELWKISQALQANAKAQNVTTIPVAGDEPWLETFSKAAKASQDIAQQLYAIGSPQCVSTAQSLEMRADSMVEFVKATRDASRRNGRTYVSFSPLLSEPSLVVESKFGSRITQRLWSTYSTKGARPPSSKATVFTSATIAQPGARKGPQSFRPMEEMMGLDLTPGVLLPGDTFSPIKFGKLTFAYSSPDAPGADYFGDPDAEARFNRYVADTIETAASERSGPKGRCKVLVLTKSFAETCAVGRMLAQGSHASRVLARERNFSIGRAKRWYVNTDDAILLTPGAWEGINLPGQIDHLVIVRLPYVPPEDGFGIPIVRMDDKGNSDANSDGAAMLRRLRQGFGRATRNCNDVAKVWICDNRFGLPDTVEKRTGLLGSRLGKPFHACIPSRFHAERDAGEVIPCPEPVRARRKRR